MQIWAGVAATSVSKSLTWLSVLEVLLRGTAHPSRQALWPGPLEKASKQAAIRKNICFHTSAIDRCKLSIQYSWVKLSQMFVHANFYNAFLLAWWIELKCAYSQCKSSWLLTVEENPASWSDNPTCKPRLFPISCLAPGKLKHHIPFIMLLLVWIHVPPSLCMQLWVCAYAPCSKRVTYCSGFHTTGLR